MSWMRFLRDRRLRRWSKRLMIVAALCLALCGAAVGVTWRLSPFPMQQLDAWPVSPVVTDRTGGPLLSVAGSDGQWRRPVPVDHISPWLVQATIAIEDERFWDHLGVDALACVRAGFQNLVALRTVSGASTITMQICRMMNDRPRTWRAKLVESFRALQLEHLRGKSTILETYLNIAPYGGNLRGVEAAAQAYFGKTAASLSLAEAALLAGLPQSPSRLRPDRFAALARTRRNHVLQRMCELGVISQEQATLAAQEPIVLAKARRELKASHAAWLALQRRPGGGCTTIDPVLQSEVQRVLRQELGALPDHTQAAALVIDIATSEVTALVGSVDSADPVSGQVNGVLARRSPGSTLKPFIYAAAFEAGVLTPDSVVYDVPITRAGWSPANFDRTFVGPLSAAEALRRSLNVPAILTAEGTGLSRCLGVIEAAGIHLSATAQSRGGLAVVVGSVEVCLLDLVNAYATLGRGGRRSTPRLFVDEVRDETRVLDSQICANLDAILSCRNRSPRGSLTDRDRLAWFMWKTGTSSGRRDAWAVGHNGRYAIGVWIGRFSGAGSPEYVGAQAAEPLLCELFQSELLRREVDPPPAPTLGVIRPLPAPRELVAALRIVSPQADTRLVANGQQVTIHPAATQVEGLSWFINGRLLDANESSTLTLPTGEYELRCVSQKGESDAVQFSVTSVLATARNQMHSVQTTSGAMTGGR